MDACVRACMRARSLRNDSIQIDSIVQNTMHNALKPLGTKLREFRMKRL